MRRKLVTLIAVVALLVGVAPAFGQTENVVQAHDPSFSWTGKEAQTANFRWSATITNPSRRDTTVTVTLQLIDASGNVVGADVKTVDVGRESDVEVGGDASLPYADANRATQYRIMVEGAED